MSHFYILFEKLTSAAVFLRLKMNSSIPFVIAVITVWHPWNVDECVIWMRKSVEFDTYGLGQYFNYTYLPVSLRFILDDKPDQQKYLVYTLCIQTKP